jgi:hypothetical protein
MPVDALFRESPHFLLNSVDVHFGAPRSFDEAMNAWCGRKMKRLLADIP